MPKRKKKTPRQKIIKKLDDVIRDIVKQRDGCCVRCGKETRLQLSHVKGRRNLRLRWDVNNLKMLCMRCHLFWWHKEPHEAVAWFNATYPERAKYINEHKDDETHYSVADLEEMYEAYNQLAIQVGAR